MYDAIMRQKGLDWNEARAWVRELLRIPPEVEPMCDATMRTKRMDWDEARAWARERLLQLPPGGPQVEPKPVKEKPPHVMAPRAPTATDLFSSQWGKPSSIHCYTAGCQVYEVRARYEGILVKAAGKSKVMLPWYWTGKRWVQGNAPAPKPPLRLEELRLDGDAAVLFVEGEKAADAADELFQDYVVTTTAGGCKQHMFTDYAVFAGRRVTVWPDNDAPGRKYAEDICAHVMPAGAVEARIVEVPVAWPQGWDLADEPPEGVALADLRRMLEEAPVWTPPVEEPAKSEAGASMDIPDDIKAEVEQEFEFNAKTGLPLKNERNVCAALSRMGVRLSYDEFAAKYMMEGLKGYGPIVADDALDEIWLCLQRQFELKMSKEELDRILLSQGRMRRFHPVRQYLDALVWDGKARVERWLETYLGAEDDKAGLTRAIGKIMLVAAVRRVRRPGVKYEHLVVLEGPQGAGKSRAVKALCPDPEWFTDSVSLGLEPKEVMELTAGKWIVEIGELAGMRKSEVEHVKALLSRQVDEARMAYDRLKRDRPREFVCVGTTNEDSYLVDESGNRRFLPVKCGKIDVAAIEIDRDQLWAEASYWEGKGAQIFLPDRLGEALATRHANREVRDELQEVVQGWLDDKYKPENRLLEVQRTTLVEVATGALELKIDRLDPLMQRRLSRILKHSRWEKTMRSHGKNYWQRVGCTAGAPEGG